MGEGEAQGVSIKGRKESKKKADAVVLRSPKTHWAGDRFNSTSGGHGQGQVAKEKEVVRKRSALG